LKFTETELAGAYLIQIHKIEDSRGFFARAWCSKEFRELRLPDSFPQCNLSYNLQRGTIRALHYSIAPSSESKIVRCIRGAILDVLVDIRPTSPTFGKWISRELTAENREMFYIPVGFAHGFQTLEDHSEVFYQMGDFYKPELSHGIRYDDPELNIHWDQTTVVISDQDLGYPTLRDAARTL